MSAFGAYSRYYNLFYQDKDYPGEAEYVNGLIRKHHPGATTILDLGCGTGRHDLLLAKMGYEVTGVDRSEEMLSVVKSHPVFIRNKTTDAVEEVRESHRMRYLFQPELELLLRGTGMSVVATSEWLTGAEPGFDTWGVCYVVKG